MRPNVEKTFHYLLNFLIVLLFLAAGLILGSHVVLKGIQKEHAIDATLAEVEKIKHELDDIKTSALVNGNRIQELDSTIKLHQKQIMKEKNDNKKHKQRTHN